MEKNIRPHTIFCDIDGTLLKHNNSITEITDSTELLPNTKQSIETWDLLGYNIILTTGRKESLRQKTEEQLSSVGIHYDQLIMGIGGGSRIIINDRKMNGLENTCYSMNVIRNKGLPFSNFNNKYVIISDNQPAEVIKPWGKENLLEFNDKYVVKKLFMKANECCSLQYHELKRETIFILNGHVKMHIGKDINSMEIKEMKEGDSITISPYTLHRVEGVIDSEYLECSTNELWDVIRLNDKYARENTNESDYK
jgi:mannose-6-phosphate isomerase